MACQNCTNIAYQNDFGVGRNMLGEEGPLVIKRKELMLARGLRLVWVGSCQIEEVKPALCTHSNDQVLTDGQEELSRVSRDDIHLPRALSCSHLSFVADISNCDARQL